MALVEMEIVAEMGTETQSETDKDEDRKSK